MNHKTTLGSVLSTLLLSGIAFGAGDDTRPPSGRSLFDVLMSTRQADGTYVTAVPFPIKALLDTVAQRGKGSATGAPLVPTVVLIPNGRSLQKDVADIHQPRVLATFDQYPRQSSDVSLLVRDRLFIAYAEKAGQLEVISYNEDAGRFEFQIVSGYTANGPKLLSYAQRSVCTECHKAEIPLFSKNTWDETNANVGVSTVLRVTAHPNSTDSNVPMMYDVAPVVGNRGAAYSFDSSTDRAAEILAFNKFWQKGCENVTLVNNLPDGFGSDDCRAHVFMYGIAAAAGVQLAEMGGTNSQGYRFATYEQIAAIWQANLTGDATKFYVGDLENRNPSEYNQSQLTSMPRLADRINSWTARLIANKDIPPALGPRTAPIVEYTYDARIDRSKQALDLTIAHISGLVTPTEREALPAQNFKAAFQDKFGDLLANQQALAAAPFKKGPLMQQLMRMLGVTELARQPISSSFFAGVRNLPPLVVDSGLDIATERAAFINQSCGTTCHASPGFGDDGREVPAARRRDFLVRRTVGTPPAPETPRQLWIRVIRDKKDLPCERMDWGNDLDQSMWMPSGQLKQNLITEERRANFNGPFQRETMINMYKDMLLKFADEPESIVDLNAGGNEFSAQRLRELAQTCRFTRLSGN